MQYFRQFKILNVSVPPNSLFKSAANYAVIVSNMTVVFVICEVFRQFDWLEEAATEASLHNDCSRKNGEGGLVVSEYNLLGQASTLNLSRFFFLFSLS